MNKLKSIFTYKTILPVSAIILILPISYFILSPLQFLSVNKIFIHKLTSLGEARNYYTVVSTAISAVVGVAGVCLGFFYYFHKREVDDHQNGAERRRARISVIIEQLNKYDEYIDEILCKRVESPIRLSFLRGKIARGPEIINAMLEHNESINLGFSNADMMVILQIFSFVDKCPEIMSYHFNTLQSADLKFIKSDYIDKMQEARKICYLKTE